MFGKTMEARCIVVQPPSQNVRSAVEGYLVRFYEYGWVGELFSPVLLQTQNDTWWKQE